MENTKLQQLTDKLYQEGLEKGRAEAESLVAEAEARAAKIVSEAEARAAKIAADAERKAEDVEKNAMTEIALAGKQAVAKIKSEIETLIVAKVTAEGIKSANLNGAKADLKALLPEAKKAELGAAFDSAAMALLAEGIEVGFSNDVKSGFKVGENNGGYYISFSDESFEALLGGYLREKAAELLFKSR